MAEGARGWVSARRESTPDQVRFVAAFPLALPSARLAAAAPGQVLLLVGDWLKRDRFIFLGWSGLLLLAPKAGPLYMLGAENWIRDPCISKKHVHLSSVRPLPQGPSFFQSFRRLRRLGLSSFGGLPALGRKK